MPQLIPPVDAPTTQHYGQNATAGVAPVKNGTAIQQLVYLYGNYQPAGHDAIDYVAPMRTPVRAPARGRVDFSGDARSVPYAMAIKWGWPTHGPDNWPSGLIVAMDHGDGYGTVSAHMDETYVDHLTGQWLNQGDIVGLSGSSGRSGGPHVHFSVVEFAKVYTTGSMYGRVDPARFMTGNIQTVGNISPQEEDDMASPEVMHLLKDIAARVSVTNETAKDAAARVSVVNDNLKGVETRIRGDIGTVHTTIIRDVGSQLGNIQKGVNQKVNVDALALELAGKLEQRDLKALAEKLTVTVKEK